MTKVQTKVGRIGVYLVTLLLPLCILFGFQAPAYAQCGVDWTCQVVDRGAGNVGWNTSLAFDASGNPAISYYDVNNDDLKFAYDRNNDGDFSDVGEIITVDSAGNVGEYTSLAFDASGNPAISYFDRTNDDLKFAYDRNNNGDFSDAGEIITVDSAGSVGLWTSLAFGSGPAISYFDDTNDDLKFAYDRNNDGDFSDAGEIIPVDSAGQVGQFTSLAFSSGPAISYLDFTNLDLKLAYDRNNDGDFSDAGEIITVDSAGDVGDYTSLAFGTGPAISYHDLANGDLKFAYDRNNDGDFSDAGEIITVDSAGNVGWFTSFAFGSGPAISYFDLTNLDLKFAYDGNNDGDFSDAGEIITVDSSGSVGWWSSLAFDTSGMPAISYSDLTNQDLKFARYSLPFAEANGPYSVNDGSCITLNGSGTDPQGGALTYAWDLDNNGSFETPGATPSFCGTNGPRTVTIVLQVCNVAGLCVTDSTTVTINNAPPVFGGPVGGEVQPIDKAAVLAPFMGMVLLLILVAGGGIIGLRKLKSR